MTVMCKKCQVCNLVMQVKLQAQFTLNYWVFSNQSKTRCTELFVVQELLRKGVSRSDCQAALESVFGESTRGKIRVNMDAVEDIDENDDGIFGTEG